MTVDVSWYADAFFSPLKELKKLTYLDLRNNPVNDRETIDELKKRLGENLFF